MQDLARVERDEIARRHVDSLEAWLRRVIEERLSNAFGKNYVDVEEALPRKVRDWIKSQHQVNPGVFPRSIDATSFEQALEVILSNERYNKYFRPLFDEAFPNGREEAKTFLTRIRNIRNDLAHGRGCSLRKLEQAICYSNDVIESINKFYRGQGMTKEYDVPMFVRYVDNIGNESHLEGLSTQLPFRVLHTRNLVRSDFRPGETLVGEIEVDSSFDRANYEVRWFSLSSNTGGLGSKCVIKFDNSHVSENFIIMFEVKTDRDWHRIAGVDDRLTIEYRVLPPI